jgi:hypothetical protein
MIAQPTRTNRLFSRRAIILSSHPVARKRRQASVEMSVREFRALGHFIANGEPTRFELSDCNFIEESWKAYDSTNYLSAEATPAS